MTTFSTTARHTDVLVVGAGIVGLGHAVEAVRRGLTVTVVDREDRPVGASVRNFGHGCATAQDGHAFAFAEQARRRWLDLGARAGFWVGETGTVVVARADDEQAVLAGLHAERGGDGVRLLEADEAARLAGSDALDIVGGAFLERDLRVDPRTAVPALAAWLATQPGVQFRWRTTALGVADGSLTTSHGELTADEVVLCLGHDVEWLMPDVAAAADLRRCRLHMLRVASPGGRRIEPGVLTGLSMLRYSALASQPAAHDVRARFERDRPELLDLGVNLMLTQRPDGDLLIGDTHEYDATVDPFSAEDVDDLLLAETARLLGVASLRVKERWLGVYASAPEEFLVHRPGPRTTVVAVTSGIGMTTGLGLAAHVLGAIVTGQDPRVEALQTAH